MRHQNSIWLYDYWQNLCAQGQTPYRYDINPSDIATLLPHVMLIDVSAHDTTIKIAGSHICTMFDRELRDVDFRMLFASNDKDTSLSVCHSASQEGVPALLGAMAHAVDERTHVEILMLPLKDKKENANSILLTINPLNSPVWLGHKPVIGFETLSFRLMHEADTLVANPFGQPNPHILHGDKERNKSVSQNESHKKTFLRVIEGGLNH